MITWRVISLAATILGVGRRAACGSPGKWHAQRGQEQCQRTS